LKKNIINKDLLYNIDDFILEKEKEKEAYSNKNIESEIEYEIENENENNEMDSFEKNALYQLNNRKLFDNNPYYNLSSRIINDEISINNIDKQNYFKFNLGNQKEIKSLEVIKNNNKSLRDFFNFKKFLYLNDDIILNILGFSFPFFSEIEKSSRNIARKFHLALNNKYANMIYLIREAFKEHLELEEYIFKPSVYKKHRVLKPSK
jgi:hypothetical protein